MIKVQSSEATEKPSFLILHSSSFLVFVSSAPLSAASRCSATRARSGTLPAATNAGRRPGNPPRPIQFHARRSTVGSGQWLAECGMAAVYR